MVHAISSTSSQTASCVAASNQFVICTYRTPRIDPQVIQIRISAHTGLVEEVSELYSLASLDEFTTSFAKLAKNLLDNEAPTSYGLALSTTTDEKLLTDFGMAALLDTTQPDGWTPNPGCRTGFSDSACAAGYFYAQTYAKTQLEAGTVPEFACDYVLTWAQLPLEWFRGRPPLLKMRLPLSRNSMRVGESVSEDLAAKARVLDAVYHDGVRQLQSLALPYTLAAAERTAVSEKCTYRASISRRDARRTGSSRRAAGPRFLKRPCAASSRLL